MDWRSLIHDLMFLRSELIIGGKCPYLSLPDHPQFGLDAGHAINTNNAA
jgi:hypothetical protein